MSPKSLDELKKLAKSALRHAELIGLARNPNLTPNEVKTEAGNLDWSKRPAIAARFLAIMRRDYGVEALEAFITETEHARSDMSETEHARERERMQTRLKQSLDRLPDGAEKLRLMIKHELVDEANLMIMKLIQDSKVGFRTETGSYEVFFDTLEDIEDKAVRRAKLGKRVVLVIGDDDEHNFYLDLQGMADSLNRDKDQMLAVIKHVLGKMIENEPQGLDWKIVDPTTKVCRENLDPKKDFTKQVEVWLLQCRIRRGHIFELRRNALPVPINKSAEDELHELDPIVDRFRELGWTDALICEELLLMFSDFESMHIENMRPQFIVALGGAIHFIRYHEANTRLGALLREDYLRPFWNQYISNSGYAGGTPGWILRSFMQLGSIGLWERGRKDDNGKTVISDQMFFRTELIKMLADGRVTTVYQLLMMFGKSWGLLYVENSEHLMRVAAHKCLYKLLPEAFQIAYDTGHFGTAAALVQHFNSEEFFLNEEVTDGFRYECDNFIEGDLAAFREEYGELITRRSGIRDKKILTEFDEGDGKPMHNAEAAIREKGDKRFTKLKAAREEALGNVLQLAVDLEQPICLENPMAYMYAPNWPNNA